MSWLAEFLDQAMDMLAGGKDDPRRHPDEGRESDRRQDSRYDREERRDRDMFDFGD